MSAVPKDSKILEIGTYCGYSSMKMALALPGRKIDTLEVDPVHVVIARNIIMFAGLSDMIHVWTGHSKDLIPRFSECSSTRHSYGGVFMDQRGSRYKEDLELLEHHRLLQPRAVIVADNVLKPGAPLFLWRVAKANDRGYKTQIVRA